MEYDQRREAICLIRMRERFVIQEKQGPKEII